MENSADKIKLEPKAAEKVNLYVAAMHLYSIGKSHPQVVEILSQYAYDTALITRIADKAMKDEWDKLYDKARVFFASGKTYEEVVKEIGLLEEDEDVAEFLVKQWYSFKTEQINSMIESPTNIAEGSKWVIISGIALIVVFLLQFGVVAKILWSIVLVGSFIQWIFGFEQRKLANMIKKIFETDE